MNNLNIIIRRHPQDIFWTSAGDLPCRCAKHHHQKTSSGHLLDICRRSSLQMCKTSSSEDILRTSSGHLQEIFRADEQNIIIRRHPQDIFWTSAGDLPCRCAKHHHRKTSSAHLLDICRRSSVQMCKTSSSENILSTSSGHLQKIFLADVQNIIIGKHPQHIFWTSSSRSSKPSSEHLLKASSKVTKTPPQKISSGSHLQVLKNIF